MNFGVVGEIPPQNNISLRDLYQNFNPNDIPRPLFVSGRDIEDHVARHEFLRQLSLPHIFELTWLIQHSNFKHLTDRIRKNASWWSSARTTIWMPNIARETPAVYVPWVTQVHKTHTVLEIHKATGKSEGIIAFLLPMCSSVDRDYQTNDEEVIEVMNSGQFPRDFFEFAHDWEDFNKYSRLTQFEKLLQPGE